MVKHIDQVNEWHEGGRASASDFNAVAAAAQAIMRSLIASGVVDSVGLHTRHPQPIELGLWVGVVQSYAQVGANKQWIYTVTRQVKAAAGYGGWSDDSEGFTYTAYSFAEDANGVSGLMGNGVNTTNLTGTYDIQPIPAGTAVIVLDVLLYTGVVEHWIVGMPNGVDGEC